MKNNYKTKINFRNYFLIAMLLLGNSAFSQCVNPPTANAGTNTSICSGSTYALGGSIGGSANSAIFSTSGTGSFTPSDVFGTATTYTPSAADISAGSVIITLTTDDPDGAGDCVPAVSSFTLTINSLPSAPTITPSGATTFCTGSSVDLTSSSATGNTWSPGGAITQTITVNTSGSYTVTYTDINNCSATSAPTVVTVNDLPVVSAITGGNTLCATGVSTSLTANATAGSGSITGYQWVLNGTTNVGSNSSTYTTTTAGSYTVVVTNSNNCTSTSPAFVVSLDNTPLSGTYTINGSLSASCSNYVSFASALADLNTRGVSGNVVFNVAAGHSEVAPSSGLSLNQCNLSAGLKSSSSQTITFQKSGAGANPKIFSGVGLGTADFVFSLVGADYVTIDGIDIQESGSNSTAIAWMESGYALYPCSGTDGAQYNLIKNCSITLNRLNTNTSTGIIITNNGITITSLNGTDSYNKLYSNTISNVYNGVVCQGWGDVSPYSLYDQGNEVGAVGQGNNISNFGNGGSAATSIAYGVYSIFNNNVIIRGNTINNTTAGHNRSVRGIATDIAMWANTTVENNTITITTSTTSTNSLYAILNSSGSRKNRTDPVTNIVSINNNTITGCSYPSTGSGAMYSIWSLGSWDGTAADSVSASTVNINNNSITNNTCATNSTSGTSFLQIVDQQASNTLNINGNTITGNNYTGVNTASNRAIVTGMGLNAISNWVQVTNIQNNTIQNNNNSSSSATGGAITNIDLETYGSLSGGAAAGSQYNVTGNILGNVTQAQVASGLYRGVLTSANTNIAVTISNNTIANVIRNSMTGTFIGYQATGANPTSVTMNGNTISSVSNQGTTTDAFTGVASTGGAATTINLNNNQISGVTLNATGAIFIGVTSSSTTTPTVNINGNNISSCVLSGVTTGAFTGIVNSGSTSVTNLTMNQNNVQTITHYGTGTMSCISGGAALTYTITNNSVLNNTKSSFGALGIWNGITLGGSATATTNTTVTGNIVSGNLHRTSTSTGTCLTAGASLLYNVSNNTVQNNTRKGASGSFFCLQTGGGASSVVNVTNNLVNNNVADSCTGTSATTLAGIYNIASPGTTENYANNIVSNLSLAGTNTGTGNLIYGIYTNTVAASNKTIASNTIFNLSSASALTASISGIHQLTGATTNIYKNKIYALTTGGSTGVVHGINMVSGVTVNIYNNTVSDVSAPFSTSATAVSNLTIGGGTTANVYFNTFRITGITGSTTAFGTSNIYASSATPTVTLRNNILINLSSPGGSGGTNGAAVCFRRPAAAGMTAAYGTASNNNIFYAGSPDGNHLLYLEGTAAGASGKQTISALQSYAPGRETFSQTENVVFASTTGSDPNYLHVNTSVATLAESGAINISGITDDYDGDIRQGNGGYSGTGTSPDVGADEFNGSSPAPVITNVAKSPGTQCTGTVAHTVTANVTTPAGTISSVTLNYSFNGTPQTPVTMTFVAGTQYSGVIPASVPSNATVTWSVTAVNSLALSSAVAGATYRDDYITGITTTTSVSPSTICAGTPATLTVTSIKATTANSTIGTQTTTLGAANGNPYRTSLAPYRAQLLVTAAEMTAAGFIAGPLNSISFTATGAAGAVSNFTISMALTNISVLTTTFQTTTMTQVFTQASFAPVVGINTHVFSAPFNWDGTSNILINVCADAQTTGTTTVAAFTPGFVSASQQTGAGSCTSLTGTTNTNKPIITFNGLVGTSFTNTFSYLWSPGSATGSTASVSPSTTTTYTVTGTDANGCTVTGGPVVLNVNPVPPAPNASNSSQCGTGTPTAYVTGTGGTFNWYEFPTGGTAISGQTGSSLSNYPISVTTTFYVSESQAGCEGSRSPVVVTVSTPDAISASSTVSTVCPFTNFDLNVSKTGTTNTYVYSWTANPASGSGIPVSASGNLVTIQATAGGTYTYTVTGTDAGPGCVTTSTVNVTVTAPPPITSVTSNPSSLCNGESTTLTALTNDAVSGVTTIGSQTTTSINGSPFRGGAGTTVGIKNQYLFTAAELIAAGLAQGNITSLGFNVTSAPASTYTIPNFTVRIGTTASTVLTTSYLPAPASIVYGPVNQTSPLVGLATISITPFFWDGTSNLLIQICNDPISPLATSQNISVDAGVGTGKMLYSTNALACATATGTLAANRAVITFGGQIGGFGPGNLTWTWNPGNLNGNVQTVTPSASTTYTVQAFSSATGCSNYASVPVTVYPIPATPTAVDNAQCGPGIPTCYVTSNDGGTVFRWYEFASGGSPLAGESGQSLTAYSINTTTTFYVSEYNGNCESARVPVVSTVSTPASITAQKSSPNCIGSVLNLTVSNPSSYSWLTYNWTVSPQAGSGMSGTVSGDPVDGHLDVTPTATGTYTYTVLASDGVCNAASSVVVTVTDYPVITSANANPTSVCEGGNVTLTGLTGTTSQSVINLGTQSTTIGGNPGNPLRTSAAGGMRMQILVLASELAGQGLTAGPIYSLGFTVTAATTGTFSSYEISMAHTNAPVLTATHLTPTFSVVYSQSTTLTPVTGLNNFVFSSPFNWDGTSNIVFNICAGVGTTTTTTIAAYSPGFTGSVQNTGACSTTTGTTVTTKPIMQILGTVNSAGPGNYTWTWNPGNLTGNVQTVNPTTNTTYTVTATNPASGCSSSASVSVSTSPLPAAPIAGSPSSQCGTGIPTVSVSGGVGLYRWYESATGGLQLSGEDGSQLTTHPISITTTFYVSDYDGTCESPRTPVIANVTQPDAITAAASSPACANSTLNLTISKASGSNTYTYSWNGSPASGSGVSSPTSGDPLDGHLDVIPTVGGTYTYTVTATDGSAGCITSSTVVATITNAPTITFVTAVPNPVCAGSPVTLTALTGVPGGTSFHEGYEIWPGSFASSGTGTTWSQNATYYQEDAHSAFATYTASSLGYLSMTSDISLVGLTGPKLEFYHIGAFEANYDYGHIEYSINGGTSWIPFPTSMYLGTGVIESTDFPGVIHWDRNSYPNWVSQFTSSTATYPAGPATALWQHESVDLATLNSAASFRIRFKLTSDATVFYPGWAIDNVRITTTTSSGAGAYTWTWNPGNLTGNVQTVNPATSTTYVVTATEPATGCSSTASVPVSVSPLPTAPVAGSPSSQCGTGIPTVSVSGGVGLYRWYESATGGSPLSGEDGSQLTAHPISITTTFYVSDFDGTCESPRTPVIANVTQPDAVTAASSSPACANSTLNLTVAHTPGSNSYSYSWSASPAAGSGLSSSTPGDVSDGHLDVVPTVGGTYTYTVTATDVSAGCITASTVVAIINNAPVVSSVTASPNPVCSGQNVTLTGLTGSIAQLAANIGTQTTTLGAVGGNPLRTSAGLPWRIQLLVLGSELSAQGLIAGPLYRVGFTATAVAGTFASYSIDLAQTTATTLTTTYLTPTFTNVFNQITTYTPVVGLNNFVFSTPFNWDGTSNILINICTVNGTTGTTTVAAWTPGYASNVQGTGTGACTAATGTAAANKPTIQFLGTASTGGPGPYTWVWNPGNLTGNVQTVNPTVNTTYTVVATDPSTNCTSSGSVVVTMASISGTPIAEASNTSICISGTTDLSVTNPDAGVTYTWQSSATGAIDTWSTIGNGIALTSSTLTTSRYFRVYATCSAVGDTSAAILVNVVNPSITSVNNASRCGPGIVNLSVVGTGSFDWYLLSSGGTPEATNTATYSPIVSSNIIYWIQAYIGTCLDPAGRQPVTVSVSPSPSVTINANPGTTICSGNSVTLTASSSNDPNYTYDWSTDGTTIVFTGLSYTFSPSSNTTVYAYATDNTSGTYAGCGAIGTSTIVVNPSPQVPTILPANATICTSGGQVTLSVDNPDLSGSTNYTWSPGGGTGPSINVSPGSTTTYSVTATSVNQAGNNVGVLATVTSSGGGGTGYGPELLNNNSIAACDATGTFVWGWVNTNGSYTYTWNTPQTFNKIIFYKSTRPFSTMTSIEYSTNGGASFTPIITNYVSSVPACTNGTVLSNVDSISFPAVTGNVLRFSGIAGSSNPNFREIVVLSPSFAGGCSLSASTIVTYDPISPPVIIPGGPTTICSGGSVSLDAGSGYSSYSWSDGANVVGSSQTYNASPSATTTYTVTVSNASGCITSSSQVVTVDAIGSFTITTSGSTTFCQGGSVVLDAGTVYSTYSWNDGSGIVSTLQTYTAASAGTYTVTVSNSSSCTGTSSISVTVNPNPPTAIISPAGPISLCNDGSNSPFVLTADITGAGAGATILWNQDGSISPGPSTINVSAGDFDLFINGGTFDYNFVVTNSYGCTLTSNNVTVNEVSCGGATLYTKVMIEGYYQGNYGLSTLMDNAGLGGCLFLNGGSLDSDDADTLTISAMDAVTFAEIESQTGTLKTDGSVNVSFSGAVTSGGSYYIRIKHRNALETWSANPVVFSATTSGAPYDFTSAQTQAYGNNMILSLDGLFWTIYSGDISDAGTQVIGLQDGLIESQDYGDMENAISAYLSGYVYEDITGDLIVESLDYSIIENNLSGYISIMRPY